VLANLVGDWYWPVLAIIILFGGSQLPKLARNAGLAMKEFRTAHAEATNSPLSGHDSAPTPAQPVAAPMTAPAANSLPAGVPMPAAPTAPSVTTDERITLTRSELDALLANREAQARAAQGSDPRPPA
jgi:Sec-independent protein translocase protein TatA